ncbi:MAG: hypothetical protein ACRD96_19010 [Bryobacteraceae bacterium]
MLEAVQNPPIRFEAPVSGLKVLLPTLADFLFAALVVWQFVTGYGWIGLLGDGDTGWHIRTGDLILRTGSVPQVDPFSFSKAGQPWFAWEWLSDVALSLLHTALGLKGVVLMAGVVLGLTTMLLFRRMMWEGGNLFIALLATLLANGSTSIHFLARPHIFTMLLMVTALWILERDRRRPDRWVWALVPLSALWTNLHGGFLALIACLGLVAAGSLAEAFLAGRSYQPFRRYTLVGVACAAATLLNPYGYKLHGHIFDYMRSSWIVDNVQEFKSPDFRGENMRQFEVLLFAALLLVAYMIWKKRYADSLLILFWAQAALTSARHAPIFALVAAPILVRELSRMWANWSAQATRTSVAGILRDLSRDFSKEPNRASVWLPLIVVALAVIPGQRWPLDFPDIKFPVKTVTEHAALLAPESGPMPRILASDQLADYLIYRLYPRVRVFFDGRSDFYGPALGKEYQEMSSVQFRWEQHIEKHRFDLAMLPIDWSLTQMLKRDPRWRIVKDDGVVVLFERKRRMPA